MAPRPRESARRAWLSMIGPTACASSS
ncbi:MAG: DUF3649 domain-containing protein [Rubrivivax sp.]|nr:MAG: DUF3649 domain-containing protein [Rubrivivax sp.]